MVTIDTLLETELGTATRPNENPESSQMGTSEARILRNNPNRIQFILVNLSINAMYILPKSGVSATKGIRIPSGGGAVTVWWKEDADMVSYEWFGIASGAGSDYLLIESLTN